MPGTESDSPAADGRTGTVRFARALGVRRNLLAGFGLGTALAAAVFVRFAYLADRRFALAYWLALAVVLAVGLGIVLTITFTLVAAYRLSRRV